MSHPPNISKSKKGYNHKLFSNHRAVRRSLRHLGYLLSPTNVIAPEAIVRQFQRHYNSCSMNRFPKWGNLKVDGKPGKHTLNALEISLTWANKRAKATGRKPDKIWRHNCGRLAPERHEAPKKKQVEFVEVLGNGKGKLRRPGMDYRVYVEQLGKKGGLLFAKVSFPKQLGLPKGKPGEHWYPAVFKAPINEPRNF